MKKRFFVLLISVLVLCNISYAITLADLNPEEKILVEDAVLAADTEITPSTFEQLEGIKYHIIYRDLEYTIIKVGDRYVLVVSEA